MRNDFESNYLEHSILKGYKRKNHKYFERIERNGRYIYFYTQAAYDAFMRKASGAAKSLKNALTSKPKQQTTQNKEIVTNLQKKNQAAAANRTVQGSLSTGQARIEKLKQQNFAAKGNTTEEKKKNTETAIAKGEEKIKQEIAKTTSSEDSKSSNKKSSGSSSKSSSGKSGTGKSSKSSGSSKKGSSSSKEKSSGSKSSGSKAASKSSESSSKAASTQNQTNTTQNSSAGVAEKVTLDTLKKVYGKKDEDVTTHKMSESEFENEMLKKYDEGSFGYLMAGDKAYKWTIENGQLILKDYDTDKEVSAKTYLKNATEFKEFQTNKKKK